MSAAEALNAYYASATNDILHHTLELPNIDFPNGAYRFTRGYEDVEFGLESGGVAIFEKSGFQVSKPERGLRGNQDIQFQLDNVTGVALKAIQSVLEQGVVLPVIYRCYLDSNKTYPAEAPIEMTVTGFTADYHTVNVVADFHDFLNKLWPKLRYTPEYAPGLKYV